MSEAEHKGPGEAAGDGRAQHGDRTEVSWDGGRGFQPYTNQDEEQGPASAGEFAGGTAGEAATRNLEQLQQVRGKEDGPHREAPRKA